MILKYGVEISEETFEKTLHRLINQTYKLLPSREQQEDWEKPLNTIIEEIAGMSRLFLNNEELFFSLLCKLQGLYTLIGKDDFLMYRRTIFECLRMMSELKQECRD